MVNKLIRPMRRFSGLLLLILLFAGSLQAQQMDPVRFERGKTPRLRKACDNKAGNNEIGPIMGQSNTSGGGTIYLCFNDSIRITHRGGVLSSDPVIGTLPGIVHMIYTCKPGNFTGPTLIDVTKDPCLLDTFDIIVNGQPVRQSSRFWLLGPRRNRNGNITVYNQGVFQSTLGQGKPVSLWFAPATIDNFAEEKYEGNEDCVNVNTSQAFNVVFLNQLRALRVRNSVDRIGCTGSFIIAGGSPEFDARERYTVEIFKITDPNVKGTITNTSALKHLDSVRFYVPEPGQYQINISDGRSCDFTTTVDMAGCDAVTFTLPFRNARPNDQICVDLKVKDFRQVGAFEFNVQWDARVLQFERIANINTGLSGFTAAANTAPTPDGQGLSISWLDAARNVDLPDSATLFQLCFRVIGAAGTQSPLRFLTPRFPYEAVGTNDPLPYGYIFRSGQINVSSDPLFVKIEATSAKCRNDNDGIITVTVDQGRAPYSVNYRRLVPANPALTGNELISTAGGNAVFPDLEPGEYEILIRDSSMPANEKKDTITLLSPPDFAVRIAAARDLTCNDSKDGSLRAEIVVNGLVVSNPDTSYKFQWSFGAKRTQIIDSLSAGAYSVSVTNSFGCVSTASSNLTAPAIIEPVPVLTQPTCSGIANGVIRLTAQGGRPLRGGRYRFTWQGRSDTLAVTSTITNLLPGDYCVTITDSSGCAKNFCFKLEPFKELRIDSAITNVTCNGLDNGEIIATGNTIGAQAQLPYRFTWLGSSNQPVSTPTNSTLSNLAAGTYTVTMRDNDPAGCFAIDTITITEPDSLTIRTTNLVNETCRVGNDGRVTASVRGGTGPYTFAWNDPRQQRDSTITGLSRGRYRVTVTDRQSCQLIDSVIITGPALPSVQIDSNRVRCAADVNGVLEARATPVAGTTITGFAWSTNATTARITGLRPGAYIVTVTASDGCRAVDTGLVTSPQPIVIDSIRTISPTCPAGANGQLIVAIRGGTGQYVLRWKDQTADIIDPSRVSLKAGTYQVRVKDSNNCPGDSTSVVLRDPPSIVVDFSNIQGVACFEGSEDGRATALARFDNGRTGRFTFTWPSGEEERNVASSTASSLKSGKQVLFVTDSASCVVADTVLIPSPPEIKITEDIDSVTCNGLDNGAISLNVTGGTPNYTFTWTGLPATTSSLAGLGAGTYEAIVTDNNNCTKTLEIEVWEPAELQVTLSEANTEDASCNDTKDGKITVLVNTDGGINRLLPNAFTWSTRPDTSISSPFLENLGPGRYAVTVTDVKGCTDTLSHVVNAPPPVVGLLNPVREPNCFGEATTLTIDTAYGGNGIRLSDYTFEVDNNGIDFPLSQAANIFAGKHIIAIKDFNGCAYIDSITINQPEQLTVKFDPVNVVVELGDSLQLLPAINPPSTSYRYTWTPPKGLSSTSVESPFVVTGNTANAMRDDTEYILSVVDTAKKCSAEGRVFVELDRNRNLFIPNAFAPEGAGQNAEFRVFTCKGVLEITSAQIYDRWGGLITDKKALSPDCRGGIVIWDPKSGSDKSQRVVPGVYVYVLEVKFLDEVTLTYRGEINLLR